MGKIDLIPVKENELELLHKMQVESFMPLYMRSTMMSVVLQ